MKKKLIQTLSLKKTGVERYINCVKCTDVWIDFAYLHWYDCTHSLSLVSLFWINWISKKYRRKGYCHENVSFTYFVSYFISL